MLFNSLAFALFLPIVFALYWMLRKKPLHWQNLLLMAASYFFYACWDWRFLFLLIFSTGLDYYTGLKVSASEKPAVRKFWFWLSIVVNLGFLGIFKYYNFFAESLSEAVGALGWKLGYVELNIILPVGISFYTFHGLSYVIDIYKNRISPEKNFIDYSLFVSFFPLLVAGPIERATHLLPQMKQPRRFDYQHAANGVRQMLWGLFMKMVVADNCATVVNEVFADPDNMSSGSLAMGVIFFAFQIYGDFAGYSNIALGTARLFGFELLRNFSFPFFSRDIAEFWRRWHISLSTWFRDYLYIPLGGSKVSKLMQVRNTLIIFLVSGFWHGANWTFIIWGLLNALYILPLVIFNLNRKNTNIVAENTWLPNLKELFQMILTFAITVLAFAFFRANSVSEAWHYLMRMFSVEAFGAPEISLRPLPFVFLLLLVEWINRKRSHGLEISYVKSTAIRWIIYWLLFVLILIFAEKSDSFIYFQF